ncbi:hypothetical protein ISF6_0721 [Piscinibacter sakaiensis]|uniref:DUF72 domain-containing protein n=1 Tax=Piscinibacter sakaiensis TaxID=1547922 RepID=A0A0K8NZ26_PISS1|nr:hypothetical protein ISF6_0721 [Piscinibacter sakaiensis]
MPARVGIGGWNFEDWRDNFYPAGLPHARELAWASRRLTAIEVNATYYSSQKPATFAKWRDEAPEGFVFSLKASRFATNRRVLAEAGESVERFVRSGIAELGPKLGPIVWQFATTKAFDPADFGAFLALLPGAVDGVPLRHAMDVRHPSFLDPAYLALARRHRVATVFTDSDEYPSLADRTADFVYARLMRTRDEEPLGCTPAELDRWAAVTRAWARGEDPAGLPHVEAPASAAAPGEAFVFFISGAKARAPAAAQALLQRLGWQPAATDAG